MDSIQRAWRVVVIAAMTAAMALVLLPHRAKAAASVNGTIAFTQANYSVHENQGYATLTIHRSDTSVEAWIRYGVRQANATNGVDFDVVPNSLAHFLPGQADYSFHVHIYDRGMNAPGSTVHATAYLFGAYPQKMGSPHQAKLTILRDDPLDTRDPTNPLDSSPAPNDGNVLANTRWYIAGPKSNAGIAEAQYAKSNPSWAKALSVIANAPSERRFWYWNEPNPENVVANYLEWSQITQPDSTVLLTTYDLVHGPCKHNGDSPAFVRSYRKWINRLADGIGNFRVVMIFEIDALITKGCLTPHGLHVRLVDEIKWGVQRLEQDPHVVVYIDAGAADAIGYQGTANMLQTAGIRYAQGFSLNATHFDWTTKELYYGQEISRVLGGVHFVVNTGGSGRGPLVPADRAVRGNEVLCNPPGRGLGPLSTHTGYRWADGLLWDDDPGESGGQCRPGAPPIPDFWPAYAVMLVHNWLNKVTGPAEPLIREGSFVADLP
jgi:endoglucanase